jgi:hypothetical protein
MSDGAVSLTPGADPAGKIALIDRGACNTAGRRAGDAVIGIIIGLIAPATPCRSQMAGSVPSHRTACKPTIVVQQSPSLAIRNVAAA